MIISRFFQRKPQFPSLRHIHRFPGHSTCFWLFFVAVICSLVEWALVTPSLCPWGPPSLRRVCWHRSGSQFWGLLQGHSTYSSSSLMGWVLVLCIAHCCFSKRNGFSISGHCWLSFVLSPVHHSFPFTSLWLFFNALDFLRILCSLVFFGSHFLCFIGALWVEVKSWRVQRYSLNPFTFSLSLVITCFT